MNIMYNKYKSFPIIACHFNSRAKSENKITLT